MYSSGVTVCLVCAARAGICLLLTVNVSVGELLSHIDSLNIALNEVHEELAEARKERQTMMVGVITKYVLLLSSG